MWLPVLTATPAYKQTTLAPWTILHTFHPPHLNPTMSANTTPVAMETFSRAIMPKPGSILQ